jgi:hypothetical protein
MVCHRIPWSHASSILLWTATAYYYGLPLLTDLYHVAWPGMAWTYTNTYAPLCCTPVPALMAWLPLDLSAFSSCLITI